MGASVQSQKVLEQFNKTALAQWPSETVRDYVIAVALITLWCGLAFGRLVTLGGGLHGPADLVTTVRLAAAVAWLSFTNPGAASAGLLALILALDLVDGWLARRFGPTPEGAIYDMEADQLTVLVLAYHAVSQGLPVWVLVLPRTQIRERPPFELAWPSVRRSQTQRRRQ